MKYIYILSTVFVLFSCTKQEGNVTEQATEVVEENPNEVSVSQKQFKANNMALGKITTHNFYDYITANGMLEVPPTHKADVSAYYGGYVKSIDLLSGQWVNAGQVLFTLENPEFIEAQQDYLEAKSQLDYLRQDYERQKVLAKEEIVSQKKYQRAKADYDLVRTQVNILRKKLQMMKINPNAISSSKIRSHMVVTSPISGYISDISAVKGQFLSPQDIAVSIINTNDIHLELNVFEKDLAYIKKGMPIEFTLQENPEKTLTAEVTLIGKTIDPNTRTTNVHAHIHNSENESLNAGMYAQAKIKTNTINKNALPKEAVLELNEEKFILIEKNAQNNETVFEKHKVETGIEDEEFIEIITPSSIPENTEILVKGGFQLMQ